MYSAITGLNCLVAALLTTAFTTLVTPTPVLETQPVQGFEIDFTSPAFWKWYNIGSRKFKGCQWYSYSSTTGETVFPTCGMVDDPISWTSSGVSAAQQMLGERNTTIRVVDRLFAGSTGGVIPVGWGGIHAFNNIEFDDPSQNGTYPNFNYSLTQQGLTAEISCQETTTDEITMTINSAFNVTNSAPERQMQLVTYDSNICNQSAEEIMVVSNISSVVTFTCQPDSNLKLYNFYLSPFGDYKYAIPSLFCTVKPVITETMVTYSSVTGLFSTLR